MLKDVILHRRILHQPRKSVELSPALISLPIRFSPDNSTCWMVTSIFKVDNKDDNVTKNNYNNITLYLYSALRLTQKLESILTTSLLCGPSSDRDPALPCRRHLVEGTSLVSGKCHFLLISITGCGFFLSFKPWWHLVYTPLVTNNYIHFI